MQMQLVAGTDRSLEARIVNADKVVNGFFVGPVTQGLERQDRRGLRQGLENEHAGHHRMVREMPGEKGFADRYVLDRVNVRRWHDVEHAIDQEHRIAVRQVLQNGANIHGVHAFFSDCNRCFSRKATRSTRASMLRKCAALRSHSR